jgi:hypothetical protein
MALRRRHCDYLKIFTSFTVAPLCNFNICMQLRRHNARARVISFDKLNCFEREPMMNFLKAWKPDRDESIMPFLKLIILIQSLINCMISYLKYVLIYFGIAITSHIVSTVFEFICKAIYCLAKSSTKPKVCLGLIRVLKKLIMHYVLINHPHSLLNLKIRSRSKT